jgi:iron complex outermembrane receptor protein
VNNALGTDYIPLAFNYAGLAPSGFIGESGAPTTFGVRVGIKF